VAEFKCWNCKSVIDNEDDMMIEKIGNIKRKFHISKNCLAEFKVKQKEKEDQERFRQEGRELREYLEQKVLNHIPNRKLTKSEVKYLQHMRNGNVIKTGETMSNNGYPYRIILMTLKLKKMDIDYALSTKEFKSDADRFKYVMAIVRNNINDVYYRVLQKEKNDKLIESKSKEIKQPVTTNNVTYVKKSEIKDKGSLFDDIW
jgi:hypothetical protein